MPQSGIYTIPHDPVHADMPHEVTMIKGRRFPTCQHCKGISFELAHAAKHVGEIASPLPGSGRSRHAARLKQDGAATLLSKHRSKPSNHRLPAEVRTLALSIVRAAEQTKHLAPLQPNQHTGVTDAQTTRLNPQ